VNGAGKVHFSGAWSQGGQQWKLTTGVTEGTGFMSYEEKNMGDFEKT